MVFGKKAPSALARLHFPCQIIRNDLFKFVFSNKNNVNRTVEFKYHLDWVKYFSHLSRKRSMIASRFWLWHLCLFWRSSQSTWGEKGMRDSIRIARAHGKTYFDSNINVFDCLCPCVVFSNSSIVAVRILLKFFLLLLQIRLCVLIALLLTR